MASQESETAVRRKREADPAADQSGTSRRFTWEEIGLRTGQGDSSRERWLVIDRKVYDISRFYKKHPGGSRIICGYAGQDATDPFTAFHLDKTLVRKHMAPLLIGELAPDQPSFEPDKNGLSANWWSLHHFQHHAKPNCFQKDSDIAVHPFFLSLGEPLSLELGLQKKKYMPYNHQHKYFFFTLPLIVAPTFQVYSLYFILQRKLWRDPFTAFHLDKTVVKKHMAPLLIGELAPDQPSFEPNKNKLLVEDFRELLSTVKKMGLFKSNKVFFFLMLLHSLLLDVAGWFVLWYFGISITSLVIGTVLLTFSKSQAGWLQHDLGHLSVFSNPKWNHLSHEFVCCHLLGLSASWWTSRHSAHHAKPNCFQKDPDIASHPLVFSLGESLSLELGLQKKKYMPYNHQHKYFSFLMPMIILATSQFFTFYKIFHDKLWRELAWTLGYYIRTLICFIPIFGLKRAVVFLYIIRFLEISLFSWISQMNHIPMHIDRDKNVDWFSTQLQATCNVHQSFFNDWFTGHLNFQIEHHLFPTMPRHNYRKVAPLVKSLCAKHGIEYQSKPLSTALADIVHSLKAMGEIWYKAYHLEQKTQIPKSCLQQGKKGEETR